MPRMTAWPELHLADWKDTYATLLLYMQIVGKIRQALTPKLNQWWNVTLHVTPRGLTTGATPWADRTLSVDFDFLDHQVLVQDSDGAVRKLPLAAAPVCVFHDALFAELAVLGVTPKISEKPQECPVTTPFAADEEHASYDPLAVQRFWGALRRAEPVLQRFRAGFRGKCSPVHFFWGGGDLAVTRFSGRLAPLREAQVDRDAYDEEVSSLGFWPGDPWKGTSEAMFYAYTVPAPAGLEAQRVAPAGAKWSDVFKEHVLPYEDVRRAADPAAAILAFAESTYAAGAKLAGWDVEGLAYPGHARAR